MRATLTISLHASHTAVRINTGTDDGYHIIYESLFKTVERLLVAWNIARSVVSIIGNTVTYNVETRKFNACGQDVMQTITVKDYGTCFEISDATFAGHYPKLVNESLLDAVSDWIITSGRGSSVVSIDDNGLCVYSEEIIKFEGQA